MNPLIDAQVTEQIKNAIQTLNLNVNSETLAEAAKWIALYLIGKESLLFLGKIALYSFLGWITVRFFMWSVQIIKTWITESTKAKLAKNNLDKREQILDKIDWEQMKEALDAWYHNHLKK